MLIERRAVFRGKQLAESAKEEAATGWTFEPGQAGTSELVEGDLDKLDHDEEDE
jgi:hypothetical protein